MSANLSILNPAKPKRVLLLASNAAISPVTGWPVGLWIAELAHPYHVFAESGYEITLASPDGGKLEIDGFSDPRHESGYSAHDFLSLGFLESSQHAALLTNTQRMDALDPASFDAVFICGGQGPMITMYENAAVHQFVAKAYEAGKVVAVICHGTCVLLKTRLSTGELLVQGKTWTGFADSEEAYADSFVGMRIQPFWIETEARKLADTNFITGPRFAPFAVRDGRLITGQQQYSGTAAAKLVVEALGV